MSYERFNFHTFVNTISLTNFSQIIFEFEHTKETYGPVHLSHSGWKYIDYSDLPNNQVRLMNLDNTLFMELTLPLMIDMEPPLVIFYVSETLFDTDSTNIEYYLGYQLNGPKFYSRIAREDGFILLHEEDAITVELFTTGRYFYSIYETDQGTKMQLYYDNLSYYKTKIFSLPGSIASLDMADKSEISIYAVYPNPGIGMSTIRLDHSKQNGSGKIEVLNLEGQLIKTLEYEGRGSEITLDNTDLFAGTYLCRIFSYDNFSVSERKVVIIK